MEADRSRLSRRAALQIPLAGATAGLARGVHAQTGRAAQRTLKFVPYANLVVMDPTWAISIIGLEHAYMTCDQLYGLDDTLTPRPQMAAGHEVSSDGLRWTFTLRDGLVLHDGERVRAVDCTPRSMAGRRSIRSASGSPPGLMR